MLCCGSNANAQICNTVRPTTQRPSASGTTQGYNASNHVKPREIHARTAAYRESNLRAHAYEQGPLTPRLRVIKLGRTCCDAGQMRMRKSVRHSLSFPLLNYGKPLSSHVKDGESESCTYRYLSRMRPVRSSHCQTALLQGIPSRTPEIM